MPTDTTVNNLIINRLTKAQYDAISEPSDTELYLVPDNIDAIPTSGSDNPVTSGGVYSALGSKQDTLVSGTNLKTINNQSLLGSGNISISGGSGSGISDVTLGGTSVVTNNVAALPAYPTVPTISTNITTDATSDTKTASPKAVKTYVDGIVGDIETLLAAI